jgi:hypothetical protein
VDPYQYSRRSSLALLRGLKREERLAENGAVGAVRLPLRA